MGARMVLAAIALATSVALAASVALAVPSTAQGCYPPPCGPADTTVDVAQDRAVRVAGAPGGLPSAGSRELSRTGSAGALLALSVAAGLTLVGGTLIALTRRRLRSGHPVLYRA